MLENNFINQLKKYNEDLELDVVEPKGFKLNEYTYVLGDKQKRMIIDAEQKKPYDTFKYYFLQGNPTIEADRQVMEGCFQDRWEIQPERGYQNLRIICDDITYSNLIIDQELIDNLIKSIDEMHEGLELDYQDDAGELFMGGGAARGYRLSTRDKLNFINWIKNISPEDAKKFWCNFGDIKDSWTVETMEEHITGRWGIGMYDASNDRVELIGGEKFTDDDNEEHFWTMLCDFPVEFLHKFLEKDADKIIDLLRGIVKEDLELDVASDYSNEEIARALAEKIGDCIVDKNVIYQMMNDFEIYVDGNENPDLVGTKEETIVVPYGVFAIYEVLPDGGIIAWNSSAETCEDVDGIGHHPINYYRTTPMAICKNLREFIDFLDRWFGRDWFGTEEEIEDFLGTYDIKEDLELEPVDLSGNKDAYNLVLNSGMSAHLNDIGKDDVAIFIDMDEETWDSMKDDEWFIMANSSELDPWFEPGEDFPFALVIGDRFYDALSDSVGEDILNHHREGFYLE